MNNKLKIKDIEEILFNRIKDDKYKTLKSIPTPDRFKDMEKATLRVIDAIKNNETINLVGDYDADGISSTAIMVEFFKSLNIKLNYIIPNRFNHGYGLSPKILELIDDGLIITVDNGISACTAGKICKERGLDLIITDHHTVGDKLPEAYAIINPKQKECHFPFSDICGAQVAWYFCASIKKALNINYDLKELFDILTIAIVADIMPMISLNQTMVKCGLKILQNSLRPAFIVLRKRFNLNIINEEDIGFKIAPLINCAGRMGDPNIALKFLLASNEIEADSQLDLLIELNEKRKIEQLEIFNNSKIQVNITDNVIVVASDKWNEGIIGIVASKLCEKYKKPSFVFTIKDNIAKASARSTSKTHLYNLIATCKNEVIGFGGHKQAAGVVIHTVNLENFKKLINQNIELLAIEEDDKSGEAIGEVDFSFINHNIYNLIESYRPYGMGNPYPIFQFNNKKVISVYRMGKNKEFRKLIINDGVYNVEVVIFVDCNDIQVGDNINFTATISKNEFRQAIKFNLLLVELL